VGEPNLAGRQLGRTLKRLREEVGLTQDEAGGPVAVLQSKMCRIEQRNVPEYHGFRALLDRYGVIVSGWDQ
jgi:predicted transcriptional regulator